MNYMFHIFTCFLVFLRSVSADIQEMNLKKDALHKAVCLYMIIIIDINKMYYINLISKRF